jgi:hypothetical protein
MVVERKDVGSEEDEYLTDEQVMNILGVSKQWLADHRTRVEPIIPHVTLGRESRYPKRALYAWINARTETRPTWDRKSRLKQAS